MDRQRKLGFLILCGLCAAGAISLRAQDAATPAPEAVEPSAPVDRPFQKKPRNREELRKRLEQLPPEQRERFRRNLEHWEKLPPDQRERLRERQERRFGQMMREAQEAAGASELKLDEEQRARFIRRYLRERQQIEETVRKEADEKRQAMIAALLERLKSEAPAGKDAE